MVRFNAGGDIIASAEPSLIQYRFDDPRWKPCCIMYRLRSAAQVHSFYDTLDEAIHALFKYAKTWAYRRLPDTLEEWETIEDGER